MKGLIVFICLFLFSNIIYSQEGSVYSSSEMRQKRRVGIGVQAMGALGLGGLLLEINLSPENSFILGYGGGGGFQSVNFELKKNLSGGSFTPYLSGGISRWQNFGEKESIGETSPNYLGDRFLSESAKSSGIISETLIYPSFGLQYLQLNGPWSGYSIYAAVVVLIDIEEFVSAPTGSLGLSYYF